MRKETERIILHALKWIIERDKWREDIRKEMDADVIEKIIDHLNPNLDDPLSKLRDKALEEGSSLKECEK